MVYTPAEILYHLRMAHALVPIFIIIQNVCRLYEYNSAEKFIEVICIFQYQMTVFLAQYHQSRQDKLELDGYNLWFTIEIISFYGYLIAAILFILEE